MMDYWKRQDLFHERMKSASFQKMEYSTYEAPDAGNSQKIGRKQKFSPFLLHYSKLFTIFAVNIDIIH